MDKRIKEIIDLVYEINENGAELVFEMRWDMMNIYDCKNGCKPVLAFKLTDNTDRNYVYFKSEVFNADEDLDSAIGQLIAYKERWGFNV